MPGRVQLRTVFPLRSRLLWVAGNPFEVGPVDPDTAGSSDWADSLSNASGSNCNGNVNNASNIAAINMLSSNTCNACNASLDDLSDDIGNSSYAVVIMPNN